MTEGAHYCGWRPRIRDLPGSPHASLGDRNGPAGCRSLQRQEVHVWQTSLEAPTARIEELFSLLSDDEARRAARYRYPRDRRRFIVSRGTLRLLLGRYLGTPPARVCLGYEPGGKPRVPSACELEFNLSHSHELAVYAFTLGRRVGVDVEYAQRELDCLGLARRFFSSRERAKLEMVGPERLTRAFLACWTRREALLKATGEGLHGLGRLGMPEGSTEGALALVALGAGPTWSLSSLALAPPYEGALAVEGEGMSIVLGTFG
jgi:4'-phosphopantetheinyl transferase